MAEHGYEVAVSWTGDLGDGTNTYRGYKRDHEVVVRGKPPLLGSADPAFRGDATRWNPEELLVASLANCHLLWYLHLCAVGGVNVVGYRDEAVGRMVEHEAGGEFVEVRLRPQVEVEEPSMVERGMALHADAHARCFIARSVRFPVRYEPTVTARP